MQWKTTLALLLLTLGIGAYISLYEIKQPLPEERERLSKQAMDLPLESVSRITIELPQSKVTVTRDGMEWRLEPQPAPPTHGAVAGRVRADTELIQRLLHHTNPLMAQRMLTGTADHPLDLNAFGLKPALGQITWVSDGHPVTLLVGETTPVGATRYATLAGHDGVFVIAPDVFDDANRPPDIFRDPRLLRFSTWAVDRITLQSPSSDIELARQGTAWRLTPRALRPQGPEARPVADEADGAAVDALLRNLVGLRIKRYVDDAPPATVRPGSGDSRAGGAGGDREGRAGVAEGSAEERSSRPEQLSVWGLDHPVLELTLAFQPPAGGGVTLFFGKPLPEDPSLVYAKRSDEPALYAVAKVDVQALTQARFEAVKKTPAPE